MKKKVFLITKKGFFNQENLKLKIVKIHAQGVVIPTILSSFMLHFPTS